MLMKEDTLPASVRIKMGCFCHPPPLKADASPERCVCGWVRGKGWKLGIHSGVGLYPSKTNDFVYFLSQICFAHFLILLPMYVIS